MSEYICIYRVLHEIIYFSLCFSVVDYSVIISLIICPHWLQWCALSPKGQSIPLIGLSNAMSDKEIAVLIVVPGAF